MDKKGFIYSFTYLVLLIAVSIILYFLIVVKITSISAFVFFLAWLSSPHVILALFLRFNTFKKNIELTYWCIVTQIVSVSGVLYLADCIFWNSDAQGGLAMAMTPIFQVLIIGFFVLIM